MVPLWIAMIFLAFVTFFMVTTIPAQTAAVERAEVNRDLVSILSYKKGMIRYIEANPAATGTIPTASLAAYWPTGYAYTAGTWENLIDVDGTLYIYSLFPVNNAVLSSLYDISGGSQLIGTKKSGSFETYNGSMTWAIPASIPDDSIVIIGK